MLVIPLPWVVWIGMEESYSLGGVNQIMTRNNTIVRLLTLKPQKKFWGGVISEGLAKRGRKVHPSSPGYAAGGFDSFCSDR